jgi:ubiquinone/menaquinone biosynthesis C-methylase UbiE
MQNTLDERPIEFVEETAFGIWFLSTETWYRHVLSRALNDLQRLLEPGQIYADILDVGCGRGKSLRLLDERFRPQHIIALEPDAHMLREAEVLGAQCNSHVTLLRTSATDTQLPDDAFDMVFCHQTFHHIADQESAMREFYRVLKPGGVLLFAESTKRYIESWIIRLLFRHPMEAQKTADEYIALIRDTGFNLPVEKISLPYLWWSRGDLGLFEKLGFAPPAKREETLVNAVAIKPACGSLRDPLNNGVKLC